MGNYYILILFLSCFIAGYSMNDPDEDHSKLLERLKMTRTSVETGFQLVSRHSGVRVHTYRNYRSVSMLYFDIPADTAEAHFTFIGEEVHLNSIGSCSPRHLLVDLQRGAFPVSTPDGYSLPKNFMTPASRAFHKTVDLDTSGTNTTFIVESPEMGDWYGMAYLAWEDPNLAAVAQQGLVPNCLAVLYTDLQVRMDTHPQIVNCYNEGITVEYSVLPQTFKCASNDLSDTIPLRVTVTNAADNVTVQVLIQANQIPRSYNSMLSCSFLPSLVPTQIIQFQPHVNKWHYIDIRSAITNNSISDCSSLNSSVYEYVNTSISKLLVKEPRSIAFSYDFSLPHADVTDPTSEVNVTSEHVTHLRFDIDQFVNSGGTLVIEAVVTMKLMKYYAGFVSNAKRPYTIDEPYFKIVVCRGLHHISTPLSSGLCVYNNKTSPALFVLTSMDGESIADTVYVPYPESGEWFVSMRLFTDATVCPCRTSHNGTKYYVATEQELPSADIEQLSDVMWYGNDSGNATVMLSVRSRPCVDGKCSDRGTCMLNSATGLIVSFCHCLDGYGAWDCSDSSRLDSTTRLLTSVLLLTLSNLAFMLSVYSALIRNYYVEAAIYAFPLVFSSFYHACDASFQVSYCIVNGNLLQFADFFSGSMAFWFTLLAMSLLSKELKNVFRLFGVILIVFLTYWDMHSFISFLVPVAIGLAAVVVSWGYDCYRNRQKFYKKSYYCIHFPIGLILVLLGLICFAFLQTENNYMYVHSFWHVVIAVSVAFLLPDTRPGKVSPFRPNEDSKCCAKVRNSIPFYRRK